MSKEKDNKHNAASEAEPEIIENEEAADSAESEETESKGACPDLESELDEARKQIEKDKLDYLMLMADFDNYRKRMLREKADLLKNAAERTLFDLLPIVDDFERGLAAMSTLDDDSMHKGMELIYNKLIKFLESKGVKPIESTGQPFDADFHEAIATVPAPDENLKGKILDTTQKGYMINDKVLRHAKVVVGE